MISRFAGGDKAHDISVPDADNPVCAGHAPPLQTALDLEIEHDAVRRTG